MLTTAQLDDWAAFNQLEPIGSYSQDLVVGQVSATIIDALAAMSGNKEHTTTDPRNYIWYARAEVEREERARQETADSGWLKNAFGVGD